MRTCELDEDMSAAWHKGNEQAWITVRREALAVAIAADEMTEVVDSDGVQVDIVYPTSIGP